MNSESPPEGQPESQPEGNPFQPPLHQSPTPYRGHVRSDGHPEIRKASIGFFDSFFQAKTFLGNDYWLFWGLCFFTLFISGLIPLILHGPMYCGLGMCLLVKKRGQTPKFETLFKGFDYFLETLVPCLCYFAIAMIGIAAYIVALFAAVAIGSIGEPWAFAIAVFIYLAGLAMMIAVNIVVAIGCFFSAFLVAEYSVGGMEAFHISFRGMRDNAGELLKMAIGGTTLYLAAALMCFVPALLMLPMFVVGQYIAYDKIFVSSGQPRRM